NGVQLLSKIKDLSPDTIRIMLSGHADFNTTIEAVNEGNIFRFLTKPCPPQHLKKALQDGIKQYHLIKAEQELLNKTLKGSIKILIEILSMIDEKSFSRSLKLKNYIRELANTKVISDIWDIEIAALLYPIGQVTIPTEVINKYRKNEKLNDVEKKMVERIPQLGYELLRKIPRLENVANSVLYSVKNFDGSGFPGGNIKGLNIPLGARIIKILNDLILLTEKEKSKEKIIDKLHKRIGLYDPSLLSVILSNVSILEMQDSKLIKKPRAIGLNELQAGQVLMDSIETDSGQLLIMAGQEISETILLRIKNWSKLKKIKEPIIVAEHSFIE
ncbi:MAG: hypothetical protein KAR38_09470, partial [Calditrichia bacterium]|nr:hypothetical protein [Calditrichia bacterium]